MSLQLPHNSDCGVQITDLFFSLKTENWYRINLIVSPLHHLTLYCANWSHRT